MKVVIISDSTCNSDFVCEISEKLYNLDIGSEQKFASTRRPQKLMDIIESYRHHKVIYVTVAGMSNSLSSFVASNSNKVTFACPPYKDQVDMMINIHSTLQVPENVPSITVLRPDNLAIAIKRIIELLC